MQYGEYRRLCPYGKRTYANGGEEIFNRDYKPILRRTSSKLVERLDYPDGYWYEGENPVETEFFFNDGSAPWLRVKGYAKAARATQLRVNAILVEWGQEPLPVAPVKGSRDRERRGFGLGRVTKDGAVIPAARVDSL